MREIDIIRAIRSRLKASPRQRNAPFESDAELVELGGRLMAFTADEFSAEDGMTLDDPQRLGWNLATATLSDLLAVRARPELMMQSVVAAEDTPASVLEGISAGLQEAMDAFGAEMIGGDVGTGGQWRYTGFAVGSFEAADRAITRRVPVDDGLIVVTGTFGDGNLSVATEVATPGTDTPRFECRLGESRRLVPGRAACIDTSDGLLRAIETLAEVNPDVRMVIDVDAVPYADGVTAFAESANIRPEAFLLGSAGEYELVAAVAEPPAGGGFTVIGSFHRERPGGIYYRRGGRDALIAHRRLPDPREIGELGAYRDAVVALAAELFG